MSTARIFSIFAMFVIGWCGMDLVEQAGYTTRAWVMFFAVVFAMLGFGISMAVRGQEGEFKR